jgi:hypothetical protein
LRPDGGNVLLQTVASAATRKPLVALEAGNAAGRQANAATPNRTHSVRVITEEIAWEQNRNGFVRPGH